MVLHIISYRIITNVGIYTNFFPACLRHLVQCLKYCFLVIACQKNIHQQLKIHECLLSFSTSLFWNGWITMVQNVRMTVTFLIYHFWFQSISIVIHIRAILDFQNNLLPRNTSNYCHNQLQSLEKTEFFIKRAIFPVKSKLRKPF